MNMDALCAGIVLKAVEDYEDAVVKRDSPSHTERIEALYTMADIEQFINSPYCGAMVDVDTRKIMDLLKKKLKTARQDVIARKSKGIRSIYA